MQLQQGSLFDAYQLVAADNLLECTCYPPGSAEGDDLHPPSAIASLHVAQSPGQQQGLWAGSQILEEQTDVFRFHKNPG
jgi:hypothetical protein